MQSAQQQPVDQCETCVSTTYKCNGNLEAAQQFRCSKYTPHKAIIEYYKSLKLQVTPPQQPVETKQAPPPELPPEKHNSVIKVFKATYNILSLLIWSLRH